MQESEKAKRGNKVEEIRNDPGPGKGKGVKGADIYSTVINI